MNMLSDGYRRNLSPQLIQRALGRDDVAIRSLPNRAGEVMRFVADISRARALLGFEPRVAFDEGIARAVQWYATVPPATAGLTGET